MSDLIEFLKARMDEDETVARTAGGGTWCGVSMRDEGGATREQANHVLRWDPARVLAEVAAKRKILELCVASVEETGWDYALDWVWDTTRVLAAVYADHPDFDPAWAIT